MPKDGAVTPPPEDRILDGIKALAAEAPVALRVSGQCMEPTIADEGEVVVAPRNRYWPGDILAFRSTRGQLRVHRLIGYRLRNGRLLLQTRADATGTLDEAISKERVIGRVVGTPEKHRVPLRARLDSVGRFIRLRVSGALSR